MSLSSRKRFGPALLAATVAVSAAALGTSATLAAPTASPTPVTAAVGGPTTVTGLLVYTNAFFSLGVDEPEVILEDEGGFVTRDHSFLMPVNSQVIGQFTSDFSTSPVSYSLSLPSVPQGTLHDVNHDGKSDTGVMVFAVAYWPNVWGGPYLEQRDLYGGGWSTAYASPRFSLQPGETDEWVGGRVLVYAPDGNQQFPSGFGSDKKLFTDDDPIMAVPQGWSLIDMDQTPFAVDQSSDQTMDLTEPAEAGLDDYSRMSYAEAFDAMIERFETRYPFTKLKGIDWTAESAKFRPLFEAAQQNKDEHAYEDALRQFLWSIPDSHIGADPQLVPDDFNTATAGGLGFAMAETDAGPFVASFLTSGGPAQKAGMRLGAQILSIDENPTEKAVAADTPWSSPFSREPVKRLQQLRYALRFPLDKKHVAVSFRNPGASVQRVTLPVVNEYDSFSASSFNKGRSDSAPPVEFRILPDGMAYIKLYSFIDDARLTIQLWERALRYLNDYQVPGVLIDMRQNWGGNVWLADQMAAYFFSQKTPLGTSYTYGIASQEGYMIPPPTALQYPGKVALLIGPGCISACEFFGSDMGIDNRAAMVGQYASAGAGGSVDQFVMPGGFYVEMPIGHSVDDRGNTIVEGKGIAPTDKVPVTVATVLKAAKGQDVVLEAGERLLESETTAGN